MTQQPSIVWFRHDLRIEDQPALSAAIEKGGPIIPLFVWAPTEELDWSPGAASRWWLHQSLLSLEQELAKLGLKLVVREHSSLNAIKELLKETGADAIFWNRRYEPAIIQRDSFIKAELQKMGIKAKSFNSTLLFEPWTVANKQNKPFQVFTPFWRHCLSLEEPEAPLKKPMKAIPFPQNLVSEPLASLQLIPKIRWDAGLEEVWTPGCTAGKKVLEKDIEAIVASYQDHRDLPAIEGTTKLSPYLHFGEISPRMIWHAVRKKYGKDHESAESCLRQIGWREFAYHLLYHFPQTVSEPMKKEFKSFPWNINYRALQAWQKGLTGYPIVDAGMRQLWKTGWMHNRVRLIASSFLVKDLLIHWQEGAKWFWDTLVDADLANNTLGWQWIAGSGADAAPYFRIFNPITQGEKFDPTGDYVRKWVPELKGLPDKWIHKPWEAPEEVLEKAGVKLGETYPKPIVNHAQAREQALEAFAKI